MKKKLTKMTPEELDKEYEALRERMHEITRLKRRKSIEGYDYTGKFIKAPDYGYMYVSWQKFDEGGRGPGPYDDDRMFFQGIGFYGDVWDSYRDMTSSRFDAMLEWYIPFETFERWAREGEIKELTKEEFIDEAYAAIYAVQNEFEDWVNIIQKETEEIRAKE